MCDPLALDSFLIAFAFSAGAASFFSPCSVGLFPAYVGYYLTSGHRDPSGDSGSALSDGPTEEWPKWDLVDSMVLGGFAASGFFILFLGIGFVVSQIGSRFLGPNLRWISIGIGITIVVLGLLMAIGKFPTWHPRLRAPQSRTSASMFLFGIGYGLASLGCTLPVFLSTILASLATGGALGAFFVLVAYAAGMGLVMVTVTVALSISEGTVRAYVRKIVPLIQRGSAGLMAIAGAVVIYFYAVIWR